MRTRQVAEAAERDTHVAACREQNGLEGSSNHNTEAGRQGTRNQTPVPAENAKKKAGCFFPLQMAPGSPIILLSVVSHPPLSGVTAPSQHRSPSG